MKITIDIPDRLVSLFWDFLEATAINVEGNNLTDEEKIVISIIRRTADASKEQKITIQQDMKF